MREANTKRDIQTYMSMKKPMAKKKKRKKINAIKIGYENNNYKI